MTQKQVSNQYNYLINKQVNVYIGRVPCEMKHIEKELSIKEKENVYGKYEQITITIRKTNFNGKVITIYPKYFQCMGVLLPFKITAEDMNDFNDNTIV